MHWADALIWQSFFNLPEKKNESRFRELFYHIHIVQHAYLHIWTQQAPEFPELAEFKNMAAICQWGFEYHQNIEPFLVKTDESSLESLLILPWAERIEKQIGKAPEPPTLAQTMLQVTSHSTYHRGQVNKLLREVGGEPPLTDFIAWIWLGKPLAEWPEILT